MYKHNRKTNCPAMSLVELVLVLCIIGIFAAVAAIPFSRATTETQLVNAANQLISDLNMVRDQARKEQKSYSLIFTPGNLDYHADNVTDLNGAQDISMNLSTDGRYQISSINIALDDQSNNITFNKLGYPDAKGEITLTKGSRQITIKIFTNGKIVQTNPK